MRISVEELKLAISELPVAKGYPKRELWKEVTYYSDGGTINKELKINLHFNKNIEGEGWNMELLTIHSIPAMRDPNNLPD